MGSVFCFAFFRSNITHFGAREFLIKLQGYVYTTCTEN